MWQARFEHVFFKLFELRGWIQAVLCHAVLSEAAASHLVIVCALKDTLNQGGPRSVPSSAFPVNATCWWACAQLPKSVNYEMICAPRVRSGNSCVSCHNHWVFLTQTHLWGHSANSRFHCTFTPYVCIYLIHLLTINPANLCMNMESLRRIYVYLTSKMIFAEGCCRRWRARSF